MTGPRPYSPDNPFASPSFGDVTGGSSTSASRYSPDNPFSPTANVARETFGPVAGTLHIAPQPVNDTGALGTLAEMGQQAQVIGEAGADFSKAAGRTMFSGEGGRRAIAAMAKLPIQLGHAIMGGAQIMRDLPEKVSLGELVSGLGSVHSDIKEGLQTTEQDRLAAGARMVQDAIDRGVGGLTLTGARHMTPASNRPDVLPYEMAAQFAVPVLAERGAALAGNLAFRAGATGVTRDVATGLNRPLTEPVPVNALSADEEAAMHRLLDKQRAWDNGGRAAWLRGEGPPMGGEIPRAMTPEGRPTVETVKAASVEPKSNIVAAAIKTPDGHVFTGEVHFDAQDSAEKAGISASDIEKAIEGFTTKDGRFVTRKEAGKIAAEDLPGFSGGMNEWRARQAAVSSKALSPDNPFAALANERGMVGPLYHGSPHKFEQFDISKIGTGEGAQAYGHGLYFTEDRGIADSYRKALSGSGGDVLESHHLGESNFPKPVVDMAREALQQNGNQVNGALYDLNAIEGDDARLARNLIRSMRSKYTPPVKQGAVYTTELPAAERADFLHWDKPISEQSPKVRNAFADLYGFDLSDPDVAGDATPLGDILRHGDIPREEVRDGLLSRGVRGIEYQAGRNDPGYSKDASNFVVFDDKDIRILNREGKGVLKYITGLTGAGLGGAGGAAAGSQIGATPEEKRRNAIIGGIVGAVGGGYAGVKAGQAIEGMNERGAAPMAPEAPPAKLSEVRLKGEPLQGPLRKPEENTVGRLALPEALSEQVRGIAREFTGPGYESFGQVKRKAQSLLKSNDVPIDFTRGNRAEVLGAAALLRQNTEEAGRIAQRLADPKLADVERAALEQQMGQLEQTSRTLFNSITSAKTEQARDLAANRILANLTNTPEHWQYRAQKIAERPLSDAENAQIRGLLDPGKRDEALRYIGTLRPTPMQERLLSLWKAMLLTNPRTHAANTASNIVFGMTEEIARNPASFADWVATKLISGDRTKTPTSMAILKASAEGAAKGLAQMPNRLKGLPTGRALSEGVIPHEAQWGHPILTTLFNAPFRFLEAADAPFFESALRGSLAEQATILAKAEGAKGPAAARRVAALIDAPTDEMVGRALHDAAVRTYKDQTAVGNLLQSVQQNFPVAGNIVMPFTKTPGAVATRFAEYTPYGFVKSARLYKQAIAEAVDGLPNPRLKQAAAENFGRATVGLGPIALGAILYRQGKASGQVDKGDKSARDTHYLLLGIPDDAFKIGGQWVEPNRLGPQGMLLSLGAVMAQQAEKNDQTPIGAVGGAAFAGVRTVTDQPFLTGVQSLLQAREGADNATKYLANLSGSLVPSVVGAVQAAGDSTMRDASTVGEKLRSRMPVLADALPTRTDQIGQPAKRFGPGWQNLISPIRTSPDRVTGNPILEEIQATGAVIPALGKHKDETPQAYQVRATVIGKRVQQAVTDLLAAPEYRALPPEQRKDVLEDRVRAVRARAAKYPAGVTP